MPRSPARRQWRPLPLLLLTALVVMNTGRARADTDLANDAASYARCMDTARTVPADGFEMASVWKDHGGGLAAEHCLGVALMGLKQYALAGDQLENLGRQMVREAPGLRAQVLAQAGEAWLAAGSAAKARGAFRAALALEPRDSELMLGVARADAAAKDYKAAVVDLDQALAAGASRGETLSYRAAAHRYLGEIDAAAKDADAATMAAPDLAGAWLERGNVRRLKKDDRGARADWIKVLELAPDGPEGDAARDNLAALDVHIEPDRKP